MSLEKNNHQEIKKDEKNVSSLQMPKKSIILDKKNHENNLIFYAASCEADPIDCKDDYDYINNPNPKKQSLDGFEDDFTNIVDYIVRTTRRIWKEKSIGLIYKCYSHGSIIHSGLSTIQGVNSVISSTLQTLHAFPDRNGYDWSVIWSGNDKDGFYTSHRGVTVATNLGDSNFGPATGRKVRFRTTADCMIHSQKIYEEWLIRDNLFLVQQLGFDPVTIAKKLAKKLKTTNPTINFGHSETAEAGLPPKVYTAKHNEFEIGDFILEMFNKVWEWRLFNHVKDFYAENAVIHYICNKELVGYEQIQGQLISLMASFPNAKVAIDRITCNKRESDNEWDVAVRWRLRGLHEGIGFFGLPSNKPVEFCSINHYKIRNEKIVEEWFLFDGIEVLRQIVDVEEDN